ncbi:MAG: right-handed parallel beta-helix repeat-containing protein [Chloroflexi bacterium]|nr:right-handed parallel beta-helix repeat-containing protein [Chloroflexota bacterium]
MRRLFIPAVLALVAGLTALGSSHTLASTGGVCDVTVTNTVAADDVKTAVNGAGTGDTICLTDTGGDFTGEDTATISVSGLTVKSASAAVIAGGSGPAFQLTNGVSNVTIMNLEISGRSGGTASAIEAWDVSTSNVTIRDNYMHDNDWNGVLVGSEGDVVHNNWHVSGNTADDNGFVGIELTNCNNCHISDNSATGNGFAGVVVQARNTTVGGPAVQINGVNVMHNTVASSPYGVYALSLSGHPTAFTNDPPKRGPALLTGVNIINNTIAGTTSYGVRFWAFNDEAAASNANINNNSIDCTAGASYGVRVQQSGLTGTGTVTNVNVMNNSIAGACVVANVSVPPGTGKAKNN